MLATFQTVFQSLTHSTRHSMAKQSTALAKSIETCNETVKKGIMINSYNSALHYSQHIPISCGFRPPPPTHSHLKCQRHIRHDQRRLPSACPPPIRHLVHFCIHQDPKVRQPPFRDFPVIVIEGIFSVQTELVHYAVKGFYEVVAACVSARRSRRRTYHAGGSFDHAYLGIQSRLWRVRELWCVAPWLDVAKAAGRSWG